MALTPELAMAVGRAAARVLAGDGGSFLVGRDTRWSGPLLQAAFSAGVAAEGAEVVNVGVAPTPALAALARSRSAPAAVVSASHNPFEDNGIKLFAPGGTKLSAPVETQLEALLGEPGRPRSGTGLGRMSADPGALEWYARQVVGALEGRTLGGLRVGVDCAHGAAYEVAPPVLAAAGAQVVVLEGASPDGTNINSACGATDPSRLAAAVLGCGADAGLALDGDGDRVIAVGPDGVVVDGDHMLALFAADLRRRGCLAGDTVVATVMANLGFHRAMASQGITVHPTPVGDRHVLGALAEGSWSLGGEQSGHIVFTEHATTGDGLLTGLLLLDLVARSGMPLDRLARAAMTRCPQVLRNVALPGGGLEPEGVEQLLGDELARARAELGEGGRVLLRPSGTEALLRVMVEAPTEGQATEVAERLVAAAEAALSGPPLR